MTTSLLEKILLLLNIESETRYDILDLGCGSGALLGRISNIVAEESTLVGIDAMQKTIDQAGALYPNVDFRQEKFVDSLSFPDASLDIVISVDTLECIPNKPALVAEVARVLRPTGRIVFAHTECPIGEEQRNWSPASCSIGRALPRRSTATLAAP